MQRMPRRIVLATFGSLGDLHPYLAIAIALRKLGHEPVLATHDLYRAAVEAEGIAFAPMRPGEAEFGDPAAVVARLFDPVRGPERLIRELIMPHVRAAYDDLCAAAAGSDTIVSHPLTFAARLVAEKHGLRWISTVLAPTSLFSAIDPPLLAAAPWFAWIRKLGVTPYRVLFGLAKRMAAVWETPLRALRAELGLPPLPFPAQFDGQYSPHGNLALFARVLAEPQSDWPPRTVVCGFPRYDGAAPDADTRAALERFLNAGEPPVIFTLGSSVALQAGDFFERAIAVSATLGCRALLVTGDDPARYEHAIARAQGARSQPRIAAFRYLPYSHVFPRAAVNVHQAGIGTLAQALAAGRPQLIVPAAFDQPDNAARAARVGVARVVPLKKASVERMTGALSDLLAEPRYRANAERVAAILAREDGALRAAELISGARDFPDPV